MSDMDVLFPTSYEVSRERFRSDLNVVRRLWPEAEPAHHSLAGDEEVSIDWILAPPVATEHRLLIVTTGQHGVEGYVGSGMLQLFLDEFLPQINPNDTGLLLVHAINPWGMKHKRRVNNNNVDLNRNFLWASAAEHRNETLYDPAVNPDYARLERLLNPARPLRKYGWSKFVFALRFAWNLLTARASALRQASLLGQYRSPRGLYYGGDTCQEEVRILMDLYRATIRPYAHILHLDMHTGFGLQYQMGIVNSPLEPRDPTELEDAFDYPRVVRAKPEGAFAVSGDMIDYMYHLVQSEFPAKHLFATSFEFGTLGLSLTATVRSLRTLVFENQVYWNGAKDTVDKAQALSDFQEMFFPTEAHWRAEAVADARRAFAGILRAEGFIPAVTQSS